MKKLFALAALFIIFAFVLSACGGAKFDTSKNVTIVAREDGSGTKDAFMELIGLKGKPDPKKNISIQTGTAAVLTEVKGNPAAIAYESLGYANDPGVKILKVDGVEATAANCKSGTYKIARPFSVVYKEATLDDAAAKAFFDFLKSDGAQKIIIEEGYVSIADGAAYTISDGALAGTVNLSGSTSVKPLMDELVVEFKKLQPNITVNVAGGGSGQGYKDSEAGVSEFGMISAVYKPEDAPSCTYYTIAQDGIAVIVHKDNPLDNITSEQLKNIYDAEAEKSPVWSDFIYE